MSTGPERELERAVLAEGEASAHDRMPCSYVSTTPSGLVVGVNDRFLAWTGYTRDELVGRRRFNELLTAGGRIYHETHYLPMLLMHGRAHELALEIVDADGGRRAALVNAELERDDDGQPLVIRAAIFPAAQRREYEEELLAARRRAEESEAHARVLARTLQESLIPPIPRAITGLDVASAFRPAGTGEEIGGDFYDVFELGADDWMIVVGDAEGKGVHAAVVAALARYTIRAEAVRLRSPSAVLEATNEVILRHDTDRFCTAVVLRFRLVAGSWMLSVAAAGHPLPLVRRGTALEAVGRTGIVLGVSDDVRYHDVDAPLAAGDAVLAYTDGVTEARLGADWFGDARLGDILSATGRSADAIVRDVLREVVDFQHDRPRDDIAIVAVTVPDR